jgi:hypothetical protein
MLDADSAERPRVLLADDHPAMQPQGWPGAKVATDMPKIYNIRQDPFERTPILNFGEGAPAWFNEFFGREGWRFVFVKTSYCSSGRPPSSSRRCRLLHPSTLPGSRRKYRRRSSVCTEAQGSEARADAEPEELR